MATGARRSGRSGREGGRPEAKKTTMDRPNRGALRQFLQLGGQGDLGRATGHGGWARGGHWPRGDEGSGDGSFGAKLNRAGRRLPWPPSVALILPCGAAASSHASPLAPLDRLPGLPAASC